MADDHRRGAADQRIGAAQQQLWQDHQQQLRPAAAQDPESRLEIEAGARRQEEETIRRHRRTSW